MRLPKNLTDKEQKNITNSIKEFERSISIKEKGEQISYHLPLSRWEETSFAETLEHTTEQNERNDENTLNKLKNL